MGLQFPNTAYVPELGLLFVDALPIKNINQFYS
jgi:hypothetical protein